MDQLGVNKFQKAMADLALLGLKHTSDRVAATPAPSTLSNVSNSARLAREANMAKAHEAIAQLNVNHASYAADAEVA